MRFELKYVFSAFLIHSIWISLVLFIRAQILEFDYVFTFQDELKFHSYIWWLVLMGKTFTLTMVWTQEWRYAYSYYLIICQAFLALILVILVLSMAFKLKEIMLILFYFFLFNSPMVLYYHFYRKYVLRKLSS